MYIKHALLRYVSTSFAPCIFKQYTLSECEPLSLINPSYSRCSIIYVYLIRNLLWIVKLIKFHMLLAFIFVSIKYPMSFMCATVHYALCTWYYCLSFIVDSRWWVDGICANSAINIDLFGMLLYVRCNLHPLNESLSFHFLMINYGRPFDTMGNDWTDNKQTNKKPMSFFFLWLNFILDPFRLQTWLRYWDMSFQKKKAQNKCMHRKRMAKNNVNLCELIISVKFGHV